MNEEQVLGNGASAATREIRLFQALKMEKSIQDILRPFKTLVSTLFQNMVRRISVFVCLFVFVGSLTSGQLFGEEKFFTPMILDIYGPFEEKVQNGNHQCWRLVGQYQNYGPLNKQACQ